MSQFESTPIEGRALTTQKLLRMGFLAVTLLLLIPAGAILGVLIVRGTPGLSWEFLTMPPRQGGAAGGISTALVGTVWLTATALALALPLGVAGFGQAGSVW